MYKIGEFIIYGNDGVCEVENVGLLNMSGIDKDRYYYTLKPVNKSGKIFTSVDTGVFMRLISTCEEVQQLIELIPSIKGVECNEKNTRLLQPYYEKFIKTHDCIDLLALISGFYNKKTDGKKMGQIDEKYMRIAQGLIKDEFSAALGIPIEEVESYITEKISNSNMSYSGYLK